MDSFPPIHSRPYPQWVILLKQHKTLTRLRLGFAYRLKSPVTWEYAKLIRKFRLPGFKLH